MHDATDFNLNGCLSWVTHCTLITLCVCKFVQVDSCQTIGSGVVIGYMKQQTPLRQKAAVSVALGAGVQHGSCSNVHPLTTRIKASMLRSAAMT
jgi:hypothetical protein